MMRRIAKEALILLIGILIGGALVYFLGQKEPEPSLTPEEVKMKITEHSKLITQEIEYREEVNVRDGDYVAEGTADLIAYVKYDLEKLKVRKDSVGNITVVLPEPEVEIGKKIDGYNQIKFYKKVFLWGNVPLRERKAVDALKDKILDKAYNDIIRDPKYIPDATYRATVQLQSFVNGFEGKHITVLASDLTLPAH